MSPAQRLWVERLYHAHAEALTRRMRNLYWRAPADLRAEALQFAWLALCERPPGHFHSSDGARRWLWRVAEHELWQLVERRRRRRRELDVAKLAPAIEEPGPYEQAAAHDGAAQLLELLAGLKRQQQTVLVGRALGLSYAQLAACSGHTETWNG